ncbi:CB1 cannabinoid receptor-interacting protein 1 isoform X2 [Phalacrocorax aristotelis]|uniref:CB1 cannabinoid receptor-interacting protein 1 isoform X2 n=1 Tax=Phalacrocorax aristotelis TaxID=126867 RepID=UPI003F4B523C
MGDIPGLVKISVSLKIQPNDGAVYFKVDGQRFGQNRTIKLLTGAKYKIEVALRPGTVQATTMGIGGVNVPLEEKSRDAQVASYTGIYDTEGVPHTKSGERQPIQVNMQGILWTSGDSHQGPWLGIQSQALGIQGPSFCLPALPGFLEQSMPQTQGVTTFPFHLSSAGCLGTCQRLKACMRTPPPPKGCLLPFFPHMLPLSHYLCIRKPKFLIKRLPTATLKGSSKGWNQCICHGPKVR